LDAASRRLIGDFASGGQGVEPLASPIVAFGEGGGFGLKSSELPCWQFYILKDAVICILLPWAHCAIKKRVKKDEGLGGEAT